MREDEVDPLVERIRTAALRLFNELGYGSATIEDIARASGVGVGTIYRRWPDKAALANDLYVLVLETFAQYEEKMPSYRSRKGRFVGLWMTMFAFADAHRELVLFLEGQPHDAYINSRNRRRKRDKDAKTAALLSELGITAPADVAMAMLVGTLAQCIRTGSKFDPKDMGERLWRALAKR